VHFSIFFFLLSLGASAFCRGDLSAAARSPGLYAHITTPRGVLVARLYFEQAPLTVANFVGLAEGKLGPRPGTPFFNGLTFHRVVPGFVIQGGDPAGTGEGGPGYSLPDEFSLQLSHDSAGVLSMANDGPDTNGSQFFVTLAPERRLDFLHSVFGRVVEGGEILPQIRAHDRMQVAIERVGAKAEAFRSDRDALDALVRRARKGRRDSSGPALFEDSSGLLPDEPPRARNFRVQLENLAAASRQHFFVRLVKSAKDGETPWAESLAARLHLAPDELLAVYVDQGKNWEIWCGPDLAKARSTTPAELAARLISSAARQGALSLSAKPTPEERLLAQVNGMMVELMQLARDRVGARLEQ
jgi:cyclophilin family peptidyl-prolyl cis-trans isomerase